MAPHNDDSGARIAKVMARAGLCSRREAEAWIAEGRVKVNGKKITSPALDVATTDKIEVDGKLLPERERTRLFVYNKPRGLVTTSSDPEGRPTIFEKLPAGLPRLISIGRLDIASEGLLLLTNDGGLARALELPETGWLRTYRVRALGTIQQARLDKLKDGISIDGVNYGSIDAKVDRSVGANIWITFSIREGKNREVRNVLGALGLAVNRLIRVSFGPFELGNIPEGEVSEVHTRQLREALGERVIEMADVDLESAITERDPYPVRKPDPNRLDFRQPARRTGRFDARPDARVTFAREARDERKARFEKPAGGKPGFDKPRSDRPRSDKPGFDRPRADRPREFNRDAKPGETPELEPEQKPRRIHKSASHVWRSEDRLLRRKFRGNRDDETSPREKFSPNPEAKKKAGLIADRRGRRILVERFGEKKVPEPVEEERPRGRFGDRGRDKRNFGDRDSRGPRGDRGERPRFNREDRPQREDRPFRKFDDRPPRGERSFDKPAGRRGNSHGDARPPRNRDDRAGGKREYDKPRGERSFGDKPRGERSFAKRDERPRSDKPYGDRPRNDRLGGDRPRGGPSGKSRRGPPRDRNKGGPRPSRPKE